MCALALLLSGARAAAQEDPHPPRYALDARLAVREHRISGTAVVSLDVLDPRHGGEWWFHLAPNRFLELDSRGIRHSTESMNFGYSYLSAVRQDTRFPNGFDEGAIRILAVEDEAGRALEFALQDNPQIPEGFTTRDALLRVRFAPQSSGRTATIRFETTLPNRHWDGWTENGVLAEEWYPRLAAFRDGAWNTDPAEPSAGLFDLSLTVSRPGWVSLTDRPPTLSQAHVPRRRLALDRPSRTCPILYLRRLHSAAIERRGVTITSLYGPGDERIGGLLLDVAEGFLEFMEEVYGLSYPKSQLTFVPSAQPFADLATADGIVIVPESEYRNSVVMDRVLVGRVSRAIAQQWFGETVWANEDMQGWLIWGVSGYLALEFYERLYGWDGPTHAITDWLAPRYREHYFEEPQRRLWRDETDAPLEVSLWRSPRSSVPRSVVHHKAPLVLRQLEFVTGEESFRAGLRRYFESHRFRRASGASFQGAIEDEARLDLGWYFEDWVRGTSRLDLALGEIEQTPSAAGWRVEIEVLRHTGGRMPADVRVEEETGGIQVRRWDGLDGAGVISFETRTRVVRVVLDPEEQLMETNRKNNYSGANVRVRPFFDWSKDREVLVSLQARAGGNAIDGNYVGLGVNVRVDADDEFLAIPGYGQRSEEVVYEVGWTRKRLIWPRLSFGLRRTRIGGRDFLGASFAWDHDVPDWMSLGSMLEFRREKVDAPPESIGERTILQQPGDVNNVNLLETWFTQPSEIAFQEMSLEVEHSREEFQSDFEYTLAKGSVLTGWIAGFDHTFELQLIRAGTEGESPIQKKFLLGDPLILRGYPRTLNLVSDQLMAARFDYRLVFMRGVAGSEVQLQKVTGIVFVDIGKGWNNDQTPADTRVRRNYGAGIEIEVNLVRQVTFPIRFEIARPYNDPDYNDTQFVFFQALAFF